MGSNPELSGWNMGAINHPMDFRIPSEGVVVRVRGLGADSRSRSPARGSPWPQCSRVFVGRLPIVDRLKSMLPSGEIQRCWPTNRVISALVSGSVLLAGTKSYFSTMILDKYCFHVGNPTWKQYEPLLSTPSPQADLTEKWNR